MMESEICGDCGCCMNCGFPAEMCTCPENKDLTVDKLESLDAIPEGFAERQESEE